MTCRLKLVQKIQDCCKNQVFYMNSFQILFKSLQKIPRSYTLSPKAVQQSSLFANTKTEETSRLALVALDCIGSFHT